MKRTAVASRRRTSIYKSRFNAPDMERFSSGCTLLDLVLGGGIPTNRVTNIVGDKSTGKTLLAMEAATNFLRTFDNAEVFYLDAESAFDDAYAEQLGIPIDRIEFVKDADGEDLETVEQLAKAMIRISTACKEKGTRGLFIVDSLDALSDEVEVNDEIDKATFGAAKAKMMSKLFRKLIRKCRASNLTVLVISQIRDKIGVVFGKKYTRSGGKALDFYASVVLWLAEIGKIEATKRKVKRKTGIKVRITAEKNKVGTPYRSADIQILFGYGVDDLASNVSWLSEIDSLSAFDSNWTKSNVSKKLNERERWSDSEHRGAAAKAAKVVRRNWRRIEDEFKPMRGKYQ